MRTSFHFMEELIDVLRKRQREMDRYIDGHAERGWQG